MLHCHVLKKNGGHMAHFNITRESIELIENNTIIKRFHILQDDNPLATIDWTKKEEKTHLVITTMDKNTSFVISADDNGYSYQHFAFSKPVGKHIFVSKNPNDPTEKTIKEFNYLNGLLVAHTISSFDKNRGVWNIQDGKRQQNGFYVLNCYCETEGKKSKTAYYIFDNAGKKTEEGFLNTMGQKDGCITIYEGKEKPIHTYYENGKKLTLGQRLFGFKRKIATHDTINPMQQNNLTR